jgi:hypothetical protein
MAVLLRHQHYAPGLGTIHRLLYFIYNGRSFTCTGLTDYKFQHSLRLPLNILFFPILSKYDCYSKLLKMLFNMPFRAFFNAISVKIFLFSIAWSERA